MGGTFEHYSRFGMSASRQSRLEASAIDTSAPIHGLGSVSVSQSVILVVFWTTVQTNNIEPCAEKKEQSNAACRAWAKAYSNNAQESGSTGIRQGREREKKRPEVRD